MKFRWNVVIQVLATLGQALSLLQPVFSPDGKVIVATLLALIQASSALIAHFYNPDGTPARLPYNENPFNLQR